MAIKDEGPMVADTKVEDGHVIVLEDTARLVPVDSVVIAVSQVPKRRWWNTTKVWSSTTGGI